jgi:hypothetical protein
MSDEGPAFPTEDQVERAAWAVMLADVCGLTVNGERVFCDHPDADEARQETCNCKKLARVAIAAAFAATPKEKAAS